MVPMERLSRAVGPIGYLLLVFAGSMIPPSLVAGICREWQELAIFLGLGGAAALLGAIASRFKPDRALEAEEALALTALAYLLFSLLGALPFLSVTSFLNGWFEAASGITTTGLSVLRPEGLPRSLVMFRSLYQWIGGAGIIVISLALLLPPGRTALALYTAEYGGKNLAGNVRLTARRVGLVYLALTAVGFFIYWACGMPAYEAGVHILSTISTGGFSVYSDSIGHYASPAIEGAVAFFMLCGATSFPLFWLLRPGRFSALVKERQLWALFVISLILGGLGGVAMGTAGGGLFQGISALTTTGFSSVPTGELPAAARWVLLIGMLIGGCGGSTAGGIKLFRLLALFALARWLYARAHLPAEAEVPLRFWGEHFKAEEIMRMAAYVGVYLTVLATATTALVYWGYGVEQALFEVASAQGTVGLSLGVTGATAPVGVKLILIALMWMGRLEILPVVLLLRKVARRA